MKYKEDDYELESYMDTELRVLCSTLGILHYHTTDSKYCEPGFPDWTIIMRDALILAEFKRSVKERASWEQLAWLNNANGVNGNIRAYLIKGRQMYSSFQNILKTGKFDDVWANELYGRSMKHITDDYDYWYARRGSL